MTFFFKRSVVTLDCFTSNPAAYELSKPDHAIKFVPDWWKRLPSHFVEKENIYQNPTMKGCEGFRGMFLNGVMIPLWSDLILEVGPKETDYYRWQFSDGVSSITIHPFTQMGNFLSIKEVQHFKLSCPWSFRCKDDVKWAWIDPAWANIDSNDYRILPGVVSFNIPLQGNINLFVYRTNKTKTIKLNFGQSVSQLMPMTEKKLKIKHHLVSKDEHEKLVMFANPVVFYKRYTTIKNFLRKKSV